MPKYIQTIVEMELEFPDDPPADIRNAIATSLERFASFYRTMTPDKEGSASGSTAQKGRIHRDRDVGAVSWKWVSGGITDDTRMF